MRDEELRELGIRVFKMKKKKKRKLDQREMAKCLARREMTRFRVFNTIEVV